MTTAIATTAQPAQLTPEQQAAWVGMAVAKNNLVADLTNQELAAQSMLLNLPQDDHAAIDSALGNYRKAHAAMVDTRKVFTGLIDAGIIQPLMAYEKRVDPKVNDTYRQLEATSLQLRKAAAAEAERQNAISAELANFKGHCTNEFFRISAQYRADMRHEIDKQYKYWLERRITPEMPKLHEFLKQVPVPQFNKFQARMITPQQMAEVYAEVRKPDWAAIYQEMCEECNRVFQHFDSDMANTQAALAARQEESQLATIQEQSEAADEAAIDTLIIQAETVTVDAPKIKRNVQVVIVESEGWAKSVMAAFITNLPYLAKYIRVKSWAKLTIGQMAEYLGKLATETGDMAKGLEYQEVEK